jgi:tRNA-Thr(GGU) m(6)t(6)A37 methyltransferase TsaA
VGEFERLNSHVPHSFRVIALSLEDKIVFCPIGYVKTPNSGDEVKEKSVISQIILQPRLVEALDGIEGFSHLFVLFYLDKVPAEKNLVLKIHPKGRTDLPLMGVLGTRTMLRPNPIGLTLVELLKVQGNVLTIQGLDAYDGTPVLDIKPYDPWDIAKDARVPAWWKKLYEGLK